MSDQEQEVQEQESQEQDAPEKSAQEQMIPKSRFDQILGQKKQAETELNEVANMLAESIPEKYRDLVPQDLPASQKIKWIQNAQSKGIFADKVQESPASGTPGPGNPSVDMTGMSGSQILDLHFKK